MGFKIKELLQVIVDSDLDSKDKVELLERVYLNGIVADGFYLKGNNEQGIECWYRNINEDGKSDRGPTNYTPDEILELYKREKGRRKKR